MTVAPGTSPAPRPDAGPQTLRPQGPLTFADGLQALEAAGLQGRVTLDLSGAGRIDTAGAAAILRLGDRLAADGGALAITGETPAQRRMLDLVAARRFPPEPPAPRPPAVRAALEQLGRTTAEGARTALSLTAFLGQTVAALAGVVLRPWRMRLTPLVFHLGEVGLGAVPIVALMAFLIGVVLAYQGATQLRQFGAEVFVVDLIAVSVLRELGILLTAIIVAGRTGAAFTAAIGSMKMREEIDAMRTLGLDPVAVLVLPRVLALLIALPLLGLVANVMGLLGGAVMAWVELGVSPGMFRARLLEGVDISNAVVGVIKAPVFALIIGVVGCFEGMRVGGNAESLGRRTSVSVVTAIFLVILADALFSIFFSVVGL
ncbi:MAG: MlaE family lipid ABC transporter permease subunit [Rhodobacteraceae bacterium]|jgi:phospholipid/cholesterol/gamma-HCH transport system permease protein|nr:MlaE family lipid ABC transporter permease subunit [Paracoccaceae bacterium]